MESSLTTKRRGVIERVWKEKKFSSLKEFVDTLKEYTLFTGLAYYSIYKYAGIYLREIGESFVMGGNHHCKLSSETVELRKIAVDGIIKELKDSGEDSPTYSHITRRLKNDPSFVACGSMQAVAGWVKKYLNPKKGLLRQASKTKQVHKKKSESPANSADIFDLIKVSDDFSSGNEYAQSAFVALRGEVTRLRLRVTEQEAHVCPDITAVYAQLGEKDMELQHSKGRCRNLEAQLTSANEKIAVLVAKTRDPDEDLKYELREQKDKIQELKDKIVWWELRCEALIPKPAKVDPIRHMALDSEVKRY